MSYVLILVREDRRDTKFLLTSGLVPWAGGSLTLSWGYVYALYCMIKTCINAEFIFIQRDFFETSEAFLLLTAKCCHLVPFVGGYRTDLHVLCKLNVCVCCSFEQLQKW